MRVHGGIFISVFVCALGSQSLGQALDPTVLSGVASASSADSVEPGRYVHKPKPVAKKQKRKPASQEDEPVNRTSDDTPAPTVSPLPTLQEADKTPAIPQPNPPAASDSDSSFTQKVRDVILGGDLEEIDKYRTFLDPEDVRKNLFEVSLASSYMYNASSSPYFFRNYINSSPDEYFGLNIWLTPFLGVEADYRTSVLNSMKDSATSETVTQSTHTWFNVGCRFRRFWGMALNSSSLEVGFSYTDYFLSVPPDAVTKNKIHMAGPSLTLDIAVPVSKTYFWNAGLVAQPFLQSSELATSSNLASGTSNQTVSFGASLGGEYRFSRQTRVFFKASTLFYRSLFSGTAAATDPLTGTAPTNVPVNNVFYFFDVGVRLGR